MNMQTKEMKNFIVYKYFCNFPQRRFAHVTLPWPRVCHDGMTNAKLVYWSGNFYLFCIAKSRVSLTAFIPRVLGIRLHVRTCKSLLCTTFGLLHHSPQSTYFDRCCQTQRRL